MGSLLDRAIKFDFAWPCCLGLEAPRVASGEARHTGPGNTINMRIKMMKPDRVAMKILKLYAAQSKRSTTRPFSMSIDAMRRRLALVYGVSISSPNLERKLSQMVKSGWISS